MSGQSAQPPRGGPAVRQELLSIQYLRGIAAAMVVLYHICGFERLGLSDLKIGGSGVDVFFVISGFIMWMTAQRLNPGTFLKRRLIRLVPLYWLFTLAAVVTLWMLPGGRSLDARGITPMNTLLSLMFIPYYSGAPTWIGFPVLPQGWTLTFEMIFYLVFAAALTVPSRIARFALIFATLALAICIGLVVAPVSAIPRALTNPIMAEFLFGILVAVLTRRVSLGWPANASLLIVAVALLGSSGEPWYEHPARAIIVGIPAAMIVFAVVGLEPLLVRRPVALLRAIGDSSYALYLSHGFALKAVSMVLAVLPLPAMLLRPGDVPAFPVFLLFGLGGAITLAILVHRSVERPLTAMLNAWLGGRRPPLRIATAG